MNDARHDFVPQPVGVSLDHRADAAMAAITAPECSAAIWSRSIPDGVIAWLEALAPEHLPRGRIVLPRTAVVSAVHELCDQFNLPACAERDWLEADIALLAEKFAAAMGVDFLRLRLDAITTNACRRFHLDALTARLVCTYRGTGTQYGVSDGDHDPTDIFTVTTGDPILLRGSLWPAKPATGLLHRSPPIEGTGETRLVLVLDPVTDPDAET